MSEEEAPPSSAPAPTPAQMSAAWREIYGDMVPERILDTKIGPDGRRYYRVQWAATTMERGHNFLEAELLIKKYWDPVQQKLVLPSMKAKEAADQTSSCQAGQSSSKSDESCDSTSLQASSSSSRGNEGAQCCEENVVMSERCSPQHKSEEDRKEEEEQRAKRKLCEENKLNNNNGNNNSSNDDDSNENEIATKKTRSDDSNEEN